jgi:hypothetical protein
LSCKAAASRFWLFWIRNNISIATMFERVLMTSCQVSLQWKNGPLTSHTNVKKQTVVKAGLDPVTFAAFWANLANA